MYDDVGIFATGIAIGVGWITASMLMRWMPFMIAAIIAIIVAGGVSIALVIMCVEKGPWLINAIYDGIYHLASAFEDNWMRRFVSNPWRNLSREEKQSKYLDFTETHGVKAHSFRGGMKRRY